MAKAEALIDVKVRGVGQVNALSSAVTGVNQGLEIAKKAWEAVETAARAALNVTKAFVGTASQFETYNVQWETLLGSAEKAEERMKSLFKFASTTPFQLPEVVNAAKIMESFGIFSQRALTAVGDVAAAFGKTFEEGALAVAGAATGEMERLKAFGITSATIMAETGEKINRSTVEGQKKVVEAVLNIMEDRAGGGMARMAKTFSGMMTMFKDKWMEFKLMVSDAKFFDTVRVVFGTILKEVDELFASGKAESVAASVGDALSKAFLSTTLIMLDIASRLLTIEQDFKEAFSWWGDLFGKGGEKKPRMPRDRYELWGAQPPGVVPPEVVKEVAKNPIQELIDAIRVQLEAQLEAANIVPLGPEMPAWMTQWRSFMQSGDAATLTGGDVGLAGPKGFHGPEVGAVFGSQPAAEAEAVDSSVTYWQEAWLGAITTVSDSWDLYYDALFSKGQEWKKLNDITLRGIVGAFETGSRKMLATFIKTEADKAGVRAMSEAAEALAALGRWDLQSAASHAAAAAGFGALAGAGAIAAGMVTGGPESSPVEVTNASDFGGADDVGGTQRVSQTTTVRAQTLTVNVTFNSGVLIAGDDGTDRFIQETLFPAINEGIQTGAVAV